MFDSGIFDRFNRSLNSKEVFSQAMNWNESNMVRVAILDLNEGKENQGMRCIRQLVNHWAIENKIDLVLEEFEVRVQQQTPGIDFDIYISSGGPGSPIESMGSDWEYHYFKWLTAIEKWNLEPGNFPKKHAFFICHSFQLVSRHYGIGTVCKRNSNSFGVFPMHLMEDGKDEAVFDGLKNPFYAVDSRDFQLIEPNHNRLANMGGKILALEKDRPHVPLERAVMAVRFNEYFIGTQFHPEADGSGMSMYLQREDKKQGIVANHGEKKWNSMVEQLNDPDKILLTYNHILPNFLNHAVENLVAV